MLRLALRNLWEHKVRSVLLGLAVVAGVGFVTAAYVFTDSLSEAFDEAFAAGAAGTDIEVRATTTGEQTEGPGGAAFTRIDAELVDTVAEVEGVTSARPFLQAFGTLAIEGEDRPPFGPPDFVISWSGGSYFMIEEGRAPEAPDEMVIDSASAESRGVSIGDTVDVAGASRAEPFTVVGTFGFAEGGSGFGATFIGLTFEAASDLLQIPNEVNSIEVVTEDDTSTEEVLSRLETILPSEAEAVDAVTAAADQAAELQEGLSFFNTFLLVFGLIALIVGAFVVYNAFRVVVTQRSRELALLRILGATRAQLVWSVLIEALIVGLVASIIGLGLGLALAIGIRQLLAAIGSELPDAGLVLSLRTVTVAVAVGMTTTMLSALMPAFRTTRISPMEALREQIETRGVRRWWVWVGGLALVAATALVGLGVRQAYDQAALTGNTRPLALIGAGCLIAFGAFFLLARALVKPLLGVLGSTATSTAAQLGRENARRTPRRTAVTATALMIGLGLVATVAVLSRSVEDTILQVLEDTFTADAIVQPAGFDALAGIPVEIADDVSAVEGVNDVARLNMIPADLPGDAGETLVVGVEPETVDLAIAFEDVEGAFDDLGPGTVAVQRIEADKLGLELGDTVELTIDGEPRPVDVVAIFDLAGEVSDSASYYIFYDDIRQIQGRPRDSTVMVGFDPEANEEAVTERLSETLADYPGVTVTTIADLEQMVRSALAALVGMVAGLLFMSVVVAIVGIVLTLYLAVFERTRETGLLRAVGMTRRQVRRMIRFESILIAVFGTLLGVVLGLFCGWALAVGIVGEGVRFGIPWVWIVAGLVGALVAGVLAAIIPARRAARMDVLAAIAYE